MSPGSYLRKRREAARLSLSDVARLVAKLPWPVGPAAAAEVERVRIRLAAAECDSEPFAVSQAELLRHAFRLDLTVYAQLLDLHAAGAGTFAAFGLPVPRVCRSCACSWHDACSTAFGPCAWTVNEPDLCTACAPRPAGLAPVKVARFVELPA